MDEPNKLKHIFDEYALPEIFEERPQRKFAFYRGVDKVSAQLGVKDIFDLVEKIDFYHKYRWEIKSFSWPSTPQNFSKSNNNFFTLSSDK